MDLLDFWKNNQLVSIVIICAVILVFVLFMLLLPKIFPKKMTQEEKEEKESQKEDQKAMDLFASSTSISQLEKEINKERASIAERDREGSITQTQMNELVRRGKDKDATEFDKKSWAYQYESKTNKLKSLEQNIASLNSNLLYVESVKWMRENEKLLEESKVWTSLRQLSGDQLVKATNELRTSSKPLDLPIDSVLPTSGEIVSGKSEAYDEYMKQINDDN